MAGLLATLTLGARNTPEERDRDDAVAQAQATLIPTAYIPGMPSLCAASEIISPTLPTPDRHSPTPPPTFGLAWFHKPPTDGSTPSLLAEQHRYVHLTEPSDSPYREKVRAAGFSGPIYTYVTVHGSKSPLNLKSD